MRKLNNIKPGFGEKRKSFNAKNNKPEFKKSFGEKSSDNNSNGDKPRKNYNESDKRKPFKKSFGGDRELKPGGISDNRNNNSNDRKPYKKEFKSTEFSRNNDRSSTGRRDYKKTDDSKKTSFDVFKKDRKPNSKLEPLNEGKKKFRRSSRSFNENPEQTKRVKFDDFEDGKTFSNVSATQQTGKKFKKPDLVKRTASADGLTRLNKYLSNAGIASRRDADVLIQSGVVKVNGVVIDQLGYKVKQGDVVTYGDAAVKTERKVYLLLNKPKDYITTVDDPQERKTVMELIKGACKERLYPVGRLDRNTTGLLLFTNDGEITTKLTHPKFGIKKIYHVSLNKGLKAEDFRQITEGVELEDGIIKADDLAFVGEGKKEIGIEIHSGRNRIVRRLFEHLGYDVIKLDRVVFAGLTKKDLPRGKHRFLTAREIGFLQMVS
jgi:23S rRNA pseudouridine2605 synthase